MTDAEHPPPLSLGHHDDLAGQLWAFGEFATDDDRAATDLALGLTSVAFIRAALRRSTWVWCVTALVGLLAGLSVLKEFPPAHQASASILLGNNPFELPGDAAQDDQAMIQSQAVAAAAVRKLGLPLTPASFLGDYSAAIVTNRVLVITVKQAASADAIRDANAVAAAFLAFQAQQLKAQEQLVDASLQQQVAQAQQHIDALSRQLTALTAHSGPAHDTSIDALTTERDQAAGALTVLKQDNLNYEANTKIQTTMLIKTSQVLDSATPLPLHSKKYLLLYVGGGLIGGLVLGLFGVTIRALVSDRLRRRDDIARVLGAPVKLSVGPVRISRWRIRRRGLQAADWGVAVERMVSYLDRAAARAPSGPAALAIVPADDPPVAALALAAFATAQAQRGRQVVLADLCPGAPAARLLKATEPGVHPVSVPDAELTVAVPGQSDVAPAGPLGHPAKTGPDPATEPLAAAGARADLLLTLAGLDPAVSSEYLAGWARAAVVVVTAGRSSAIRVHAVGEMLRFAGIEQITAVLVGADKTDESLGLTVSAGAIPVGPGLS